MSTNIASREEATSRPRVWRWLSLSLLSLLAIALGLLAWGLSIVQSPLPRLDGSVSVAGISGPVSITRDGHGVPTIEAPTLRDVFFAQGYITAQDRLFQMDLMRRAASGELSE